MGDASLGRIVVSRTDRIGDTVMTLPLFGALRAEHPGAELVFLGRPYVAAVASACQHVDRFVPWPEPSRGRDRVSLLAGLEADAIVHALPRRDVAWAARRARIPLRVGTSRRALHWLTCNRRVNLSRRGSRLHEAQLNIRLAAPLLARTDYPKEQVVSLLGLTRIPQLEQRWRAALDASRLNLVIHPLTGGSVPAWPLERFAELAGSLAPERWRVLVTGSAAEGAALRPWLAKLPAHVVDVTGQPLDQLIALLNAAFGIVAASTGPLHVAAALGRRALGLYPTSGTRAPERWSPLGSRAEIVLAPSPSALHPGYGVESIPVADVRRVLDRWASG